MKKLVLLLGLISITTNAQVLNNKQEFTRQDSLRGTNNEFRNWWDVKHYNVCVQPKCDDKAICGVVEIEFDIVKENHPNIMQIDLQE